MKKHSGAGAVALAIVFALSPAGPSAVFSTAFAQSAAPVVVENVSLDFGFGVMRIPRMEAIGANMSADEFRALLTAKDGAPAHERLRAFSAAAISAPTVELEQMFATSRQTQTYRDVHFEGVRDGRIERIVSLSGAISGAMDEEPFTGSQGVLTVTGVNVAGLTQIVTTGASADGAAATLYESFTLDQYGYNTPKFDMAMRDLSGRGVRLSPTREPIAQTLARLAQIKPGDKAQPAEALQGVAGVFAMFRALTIDESVAGSMTMTGKDPTARFTGSARNLAMRDFRDGRIGVIEARDIEGRGERGATMRLGHFELTGFDMGATIDATAELAQDPSRADGVNPAKLIPQFDRFALTDLATGSPHPERGDDATALLRVAIQAFRIERAESKTQEARHVRWQAAIERMRISAAKDDARLEALRTFGYDSLDVDWSMAIDWKPADTEIALSEFAISGAGMGSAALSAKLANVTEAIFTADRKVAALALLPVALKSAQLRLSDAGLLQKYVAHVARTKKIKPGQARQRLAREMAQAIPAPPDAPAAKQFAKALSDFLRDPKSPLTIKAVAEPGISAIDVATVKPPQGLWRRVKIETTRR